MAGTRTDNHVLMRFNRRGVFVEGWKARYYCIGRSDLQSSDPLLCALYNRQRNISGCSGFLPACQQRRAPGSRCSADCAPGRRRTSARPAGRPPARPAPAAWPAPSRTAAPRRAALEAHPGHAHCGGRGAVEELARVERAAGHAHRLLHHPRRIDAGGGPRGGLGLEPRIAAQRQRAGEPRRCSRWPKLHLTRISLRAAISRLLVVLSSYRPRLGFSR